MKKYNVKSGELNIEVTAINERLAAIKALELNNKSLGLLICVHPVKGKQKDDMFFKTEFILNCMGIEVE